MEGVDQPIWHFGSTGGYSVSSGYRWWVENVSSISLHRLAGPWPKLWAVDAPPKLRIMSWRLIRDIVPTRAVLEHRHIEVPQECGICGHGVETNQHMFLECTFAKECWKEAGLEGFVREVDSSSNSFQEWMIAMIQHRSSVMIEKTMALLWSLWRERNARVWRNELKPAFVVTRLAIESLTDWQASRRPASTTGLDGPSDGCKGLVPEMAPSPH
ncbi:hypothetical protein LINPERHAP1_LOCUS703 [Linum perenne]